MHEDTGPGDNARVKKKGDTTINPEGELTIPPQSGVEHFGNLVMYVRYPHEMTARRVFIGDDDTLARWISETMHLYPQMRVSLAKEAAASPFAQEAYALALEVQSRCPENQSQFSKEADALALEVQGIAAEDMLYWADHQSDELAQRVADAIDMRAPGAKADAGKVRPNLVFSGFPRALIRVAEVATFGANKYSDGGWAHVADGMERYTNAKQRHELSHACGEHYDPESGMLHLAHAAWNALAILELYLREHSNKECPDEQAHY